MKLQIVAIPYSLTLWPRGERGGIIPHPHSRLFSQSIRRLATEVFHETVCVVDTAQLQDGHHKHQASLHVVPQGSVDGNIDAWIRGTVSEVGHSQAWGTPCDVGQVRLTISDTGQGKFASLGMNGSGWLHNYDGRFCIKINGMVSVCYLIRWHEKDQDKVNVVFRAHPP